MKLLALTLLTTCLWLTPLTASYAQTNPKPYPVDKRILRVDYEDNNVTALQGKTFTATQITFSDHEEVLDVEGGDSAAWMVTYHTQLPNMVFIKPTLLGSESNLTIVTNKHSYYFHLASNKTLDEGLKTRAKYLKRKPLTRCAPKKMRLIHKKILSATTGITALVAVVN